MNELSWHFYLSSVLAWDAMLLACENARESIDLEQFILRTDEVGNKFLDLLARKASEGIKVRVLCDAAGSFGLYNSSVPARLEKAGLSIAFFNTLFPGGKHNHTPWFFRDHQKLLIVDGKQAFTGGICLSQEMKSWRDTHVRIEGDVVRQMRHTFNHMWHRAFKMRFRLKVKALPTDSGFEYVTNAPLPRRRYLYHRYLEAIRGARHSIYLTTPYFVPDARFVRVLVLAARRGVDVRLLLPHSSDHPIVDLAGRSYFARLLKAGVRIYHYKDVMIHAKTAVIDESWATVGSFNLDNVSFLYNFEGNIVSTNLQFVREIKSHFMTDIEKADLIEREDWENRSFVEKILEWCTWPIRKIL